MPANNPYSSVDFNQDGDVSNLELAAAHEQSGDISGRKKRPLLGQLSLGIIILLFGLLLSIVGKFIRLNAEKPGYMIVGIVISVTAAAYIIFVSIRFFIRKKQI